MVTGIFKILDVPFSIFKPTGNGIEPDFDDIEIIDDGQTLRLGKYEAIFDSVLYECDKEYRKSIQYKDKSVGACILRARNHKGLRQRDFPEISTRDIGRIERGQTKKPRKETLEHILSVLGIGNIADLLTY